MKVILGFVLSALVALPVWAQPAQVDKEKKETRTDSEATTERSTGATFEVLEAKLCGGVQDRKPVDEKSTFSAGDKAWIWLSLKPAGETSMRLRWSLEGKPFWTMDPVPVRAGNTWYYKTLHQPGTWQVDVLDPGDRVVHSISLTAVGGGRSPGAPATGSERPQAAGPATEKAKAEPAQDASASASAGGHFDVLEIKLAANVENREPVDVATSFEKGAKVYTWVKLRVNEPETAVRLRYSLGDKVVWTSSPVTVKQSPSWRTWLYRKVEESGDWRVQVLDADEKPVHSTNFTVR